MRRDILLRIALAILAFSLPLLAACGGGGSGLAPAIPQPLAAPLGSMAALMEAQSDARQAPQPLYTPGTNDLLYVGNQGNNSITVYKHDVSGNTSPIKVIAGSKTGLVSPGQLSEDALGNLYVANRSALSQTSVAEILVFGHGATGNVSPVRKLTIRFPGHVQLASVEGAIVDQSTGKLFVSVHVIDANTGPTGYLLRYPPNAAGTVAPFARLEYIFHVLQLALDSTGTNFLVAQGNASNDSFYGIDTFAKQFPNGGPLTGPKNGGFLVADLIVSGIADDPTTKTYLVAHGNRTTYPGIVRMSETTTGDGPDYIGEPLSLHPLPISFISNATDCTGQLALGYLRNIYAACGSSVKVYGPTASGNVSPLRVLKGSATKLNQPYGIYEGQ